MIKITNIISFLIFLKISLCMIVFPFKAAYENKNGNINKDSKEYNSTHFLNDYFDRQLYITIKIGSPPQEVKVLLTSKYCAFKIGKSDHCIYSDEYLSYYNRNNSKDFSYTNMYNMTFQEFDNQKGFTAEDSMYAYTDINLKNEKKFDKIGFFLGSDTNEKLCGIIGFKMDNYDYHCNKINNIIRSFKSNDIINNYKWYLKYNTIDEGYFIIGSNMQELIINYNEKYLFSIESFMFGGTFPWGFFIKEIKCGKNREIISKEDKRGEIENDYSIIIGSETYYNYINKTFFYNYLQKGICMKNIWKKNQFYDYYIIECNKEQFGKEDYIKFPELIFDVKQEDFNGEFILDYNDLFTETKYKYFFNVIFNTYKNEIWTLGKQFIKKYPIMFDLDSKYINIYDLYSEGQTKNNENMNQDSKGIKTFLIILLIIVLVVVVGVLGYFLGKNLNKIRKRKANELNDDDYDYTSENNNAINDNQS